MNNLRKSFGNRVKELRKSKNISQEKLGERAGLHYTYIGGIERGERNVSLENIEKIAKGLEVNIGELFPFAMKKNTENDSIRNEIINTLYDYDTKTLKFLLSFIKSLREWLELKNKK